MVHESIEGLLLTTVHGLHLQLTKNRFEDCGIVPPSLLLLTNPVVGSSPANLFIGYSIFRSTDYPSIHLLRLPPPNYDTQSSNLNSAWRMPPKQSKSEVAKKQKVPPPLPPPPAREIKCVFICTNQKPTRRLHRQLVIGFTTELRSRCWIRKMCCHIIASDRYFCRLFSWDYVPSDVIILMINKIIDAVYAQMYSDNGVLHMQQKEVFPDYYNCF
ncbi:hypothetical protein LXL04_028895 [Taraxacum kok-saghyz]